MQQVAKILRVYKERYALLSMDHRINHVTIFKNHGARCRRQSAASALPAYRHSRDSQPGEASAARGPAPLR